MTKRPPRIKRAPHDKENPYYMASRATAQDKDISYEALGLLNFILSKPDSWEIQPAGLVRAGCKRNRVYRLLNELIDHKYIERVYNRDAKGKVRSVDYVAHETPYEEMPLPTNPLPEKQEMEKQEVENPEMGIGYIIYNREEKNTEKDISAPKIARKPDPYFDAIAEIFKTAAGGYIGNLKSMMLGTSKRGEWKRCNFDPPVVDPAEIRDFGAYMRKRMAEKNLTDPPSACVTIQRWFYDFRDEMVRKAARKITQLDPAQDLSILVPFDAPLDRFLKEQEDAS